MDTDKIVDSSYVLALRHALNRIEVNFLAGVDNETTLREFREWIREKGGEEPELTLEEEREENEL